MRNIFIEELTAAAKKNKKIILVVNDLGYSVIENFAKQLPNQFFNAGVAEQNMIGLASGLAMDGNHVFVYSIGNFPTFRCAEQIRNDIDYHKLPVTIVNVGGGLGYGSLGYTHHSLQDYSLLRVFPNILIASPCDNMEAKSCIRYLLKHPQPSYLRLVKKTNILFHKNLPKVKPGEWKMIKKNKKKEKTFLITGGTSILLKDKMLNKKYKDFNIYSLPLWGMKQKLGQSKKIKKWKEIITLEDHFLDGGFGSWLKESCENVKTKILNEAISTKVIGKTGNESYLIKKYFNK